MKKTLISVAALTVCAGMAFGQTFYATNNLAVANGYTSSGDQLITFDWQTALWAPVGPGNGEIIDNNGVARPGLGGLDFNSTGTVLYAADSFGLFPGQIMTIDPMTAQATILGTAPAAMHDLAWDPVTNSLYGSDSAGNLYSGLENPGTAQFVGNFGIGTLEVGLGFDGQGNLHVLDLITDVIYVGLAPNLTALAPLHVLPFDANFSQGLFVDWHGTNGPLNQGYHAAFNQTAFQQQNWWFGSAAGGGPYGPMASVFATDPFTGLPQVEVGDLTYAIPAPSSLMLLGLGALAARRRR